MRRTLLYLLLTLLPIASQAQQVVDTAIRQCVSLQLTATEAERHIWSPNEGISDIYSGSPTVSPQRAITYTAQGFTLGNNLVTNSDFEEGNTGFATDYSYFTISNNTEGQYTIGDNGHRYNSGFVSLADHTTGTGLYMVVNGSTTANTVVWEQEMELEANTYYSIRFWLANLNTISPARLRVKVNGSFIGDEIVTTATGQWIEYSNIWYNQRGQHVIISITNQNTAWSGNDFGLDDIMIQPWIAGATDTFRIRMIGDTVVANVCDAYTWPETGITYSEEGYYYKHTTTATGCDSITTLFVSLGHNGTVHTIDSACGEYTWAFNRITYTESDTYHDTVMNAGGCLDYGTLDLIIRNCQLVETPDNVDDARCSMMQPATSWSIRNSWSSGGGVSNHNTPMVGDLDDDGNPEIMCFGSSGETDNNGLLDNTILVYDGVTKNLKCNIRIAGYVTAYDAGAYGLVKLPNRKGLIVVACRDHYLRAYDITSTTPATPFWVSDQPYGSNNQYAVNISFADFNNDGHPEIAIRNKIYDAATGVLLATATGGSNAGASFAHYSHRTGRTLFSPMVANIIGDDRQELILGNEIYDVVITNRSGTTGNSITMVKTIVPPAGVPQDGHAQVADFDLDGHLDIFISNKNTHGAGGYVSMYVWDVARNRVSPAVRINTNMSGKSLPLIADIDGDDQLEVTIQCAASGVGNNRVRTYKYNATAGEFEFLWGFPVDEDSYSNGMTAFDFNLDGATEMLICDQSRIRVVDGAGNTMNTFSFSETTIMQYPVIADIDNDGHAEIISVGSGRLNVFKSVGQPWAPARKVWNQYMYNVTNVNNDLTVPRYYYNNSTALYDPDGVTIRRPFNNFLQQATTIDPYGRPYYTAVDAAIAGVDAATTHDSITIDIAYTNQGSNTLFAPYRITLYFDSMGGNILQTATIGQDLLPDGNATLHVALPLSNVCRMNTNHLYVSLNDGGNGRAQYGGQATECDTSNNGKAFTIDIPEPEESQQDVARCDNYTWEATGSTYDYSGRFVDTTQCRRPAAAGCDSIRILNLTIYPSYHLSTDTIACDLFRWPIDSTYYYESATKTLSYHTIHGCDSIWNLTVEVYYTSYGEEFVEGCNTYYWPVDRRTYTHSIIHAENMTSSHGCDSTRTLVLHMHYTSYDTTYDTICNGSMRAFFGKELTASGTYTHNSTTLRGCDSISVINLYVRPKLEPDFDSISDCNNLTLTLRMHPADSNVHLRWSRYPDDWSLQGHSRDSVLVLSPTLSSLYTLTATYADGLPCPASKSIKADVIRPVEAVIYQSAAYFTPSIPTIRLSAIGPNISKLAWFVNRSFYDLSPTTIIYDPETPDTMEVSLVAFNERCSDTARIALWSLQQSLYVPNVFTPGEERNRTFRVRGQNIEEYEITIYNRKGIQTYQSSSIDNSWDGTLPDGTPAPMGSYVYHIRYRTSVAPDELLYRTGTVLLIR